MDGKKNRRMDGRMNGMMDGGKAEVQMDGRKYRWNKRQ